jgi:ubiquinone/menaquinone biosynthesis C-methylase UbiE
VATLIGDLHERLVFDRRTTVLARDLSALLPSDATVLDVGCGDGTIDSLILATRLDVSIEGVDVLARPSTKIPVKPFDGRTLPQPDNSVDVVMFIDVLHHTDDPMVLLREAKRVARKMVLLKDHRMAKPFAYLILRFMDWVGNAHHSVVLPYNYWPEAKWRAAFTELQMPIAQWRPKVDLYPFPASLIFERGLHFIAAVKP